MLTHSSKPFRDRIPDYLPGAFPVGIDLFPLTREEMAQLERENFELYAAISSGREVT